MVGIIPKEDAKYSKGSKFLFYFAIFLLISSVASYFLIDFFLEEAKSEISSLEMNLAEIMSPEKISLEKEILAYKKDIDNISYLMGRHLKASKIFEIIEKTTHPQVWFKEFTLSPDLGEFIISGESENFEILGQQLLIFEEEEELNEVNLGKALINNEGKIDFVLFALFNPDILKSDNF
jgi:hypothetical protein